MTNKISLTAHVQDLDRQDLDRQDLIFQDANRDVMQVLWRDCLMGGCRGCLAGRPSLRHQ